MASNWARHHPLHLVKSNGYLALSEVRDPRAQETTRPPPHSPLMFPIGRSSATPLLCYLFSLFPSQAAARSSSEEGVAGVRADFDGGAGKTRPPH